VPNTPLMILWPFPWDMPTVVDLTEDELAMVVTK
jgi:hypothetical protein